MEIVIVNFSLEGMAESEYVDLCDILAPAFAAVPGLATKVWLADSDNGLYGGVYTFEDAAAVDAFMSSDLFAQVGATPQLTGISGVAAICRVARGHPLALRLAIEAQLAAASYPRPTPCPRSSRHSPVRFAPAWTHRLDTRWMQPPSLAESRGACWRRCWAKVPTRPWSCSVRSHSSKQPPTACACTTLSNSPSSSVSGRSMVG